AVLGEQGAKALFDAQGRLREQHLFKFALQRDAREGKGRIVAARRFDQRGETLRRLEPGAGDGDAERCDLLFRGGEPARVAAFVEQAIASAQRPLEARDASAMLGVDAKRQSVEKAPPLARRAREEP